MGMRDRAHHWVPLCGIWSLVFPRRYSSCGCSARIHLERERSQRCRGDCHCRTTGQHALRAADQPHRPSRRGCPGIGCAKATRWKASPSPAAHAGCGGRVRYRGGAARRCTPAGAGRSGCASAAANRLQGAAAHAERALGNGARGHGPRATAASMPTPARTLAACACVNSSAWVRSLAMRWWPVSVRHASSRVAGNSPPGWLWRRANIASGGRARLGEISCRGDGYLRTLLIQGARRSPQGCHYGGDRKAYRGTTVDLLVAGRTALRQGHRCHCRTNRLVSSGRCSPMTSTTTRTPACAIRRHLQSRTGPRHLKRFDSLSARSSKWDRSDLHPGENLTTLGGRHPEVPADRLGIGDTGERTRTPGAV